MVKWSSSFRSWRAALVVGCVGLSAAGCGPVPTAVEGSVTLDGAPLDEAAVMFVPLEHGRSKTGALIENGKYKLPPNDGLLPGAYRVEIVDNGPVHPPPNAKKRRTLPPQYSHNSPFRIDVPSGTSATAPLVASFELKSKPSARAP
jgi:hypothetical protein